MVARRPQEKAAAAVLVGRDDEIADARDALERAHASPVVLLIRGEAGIGKSAVLAAAVHMANESGFRVLRGGSHRPEMRYAFGPFIDMLGRGIWAQPGVAEESMPDRYRMHRALTHEIATITNSTATAIALEDLHWADDASLELFAHLARRLSGPVLLVATVRDERPPRQNLLMAFNDIPRERLQSIFLRELPADAVGALARNLLGGAIPLTRQLRDQLHAKSGGNPLLLIEIVRSLSDQQLLMADGGRWHLAEHASVVVPGSVREGVMERLHALRPTTQRIIRTASLLGFVFDYGVLAEVTQVAEAELLDSLNESVAANLVVEADGQLTFRHALTREAVLECTLQRERQLTHGRIAAVLESRSSNAADLAYHYDAAGEFDAAFRRHVSAAREYQARNAFAEALRHLTRAIELAPKHEDTMTAGLHLDAATCASTLQLTETRMSHAATALELFERAGDSLGQGRALVHLSSREAMWPEQKQMDLERRCLEILEPPGDTRELAEALCQTSHLNAFRGRSELAQAQVEKALLIADRIGSPDARAFALRRKGVAYIQRPEEAAGYFEEALDFARQRGLWRHELTVLGNLAQLAFRGYGRASNAELSDRQRQLAEQFGVPGYTQNWQNQIYASGRWKEFSDLVNRVGDDLESPEQRDQLAMRLAIVETAVRGPGAALSKSIEALARAVATGHRFSAHIVFSQGMYVAERYRDVLEALQPLVPRWPQNLELHGDLLLAPLYAICAATELEDDGSIARWIDLAAVAEAHAAWPRDAYGRVVRKFTSAVRAERAGDLGEALARLDQLLAGDPPIPSWDPVEPSMIAMFAIRFHLKRASAEDRALAARILAKDVAVWRTFGADWYLGRLRERARTWGLPFPSTPRSSSGELTARELEVAKLVAKGHTNKDIAALLTISVRTAESHVDQIRTKLGLRTRTQIGAWITQRYGPVSPD